MRVLFEYKNEFAGKRIRDASIYMSKKISLKLLFFSHSHRAT